MVKNVYGVYVQNLPLTNTDFQQESAQIEEDIKQKLILENGMLTLPNPLKLRDDWIIAPANLPETTFSNIDSYLKSNEAGKAYKGVKSLLLSGHLSNVMIHMLSPDVRYCFVRGLCLPEQKFSNSRYNVRVILQKDNGSIINGHCGCAGG